MVNITKNITKRLGLCIATQGSLLETHGTFQLPKLETKLIIFHFIISKINRVMIKTVPIIYCHPVYQETHMQRGRLIVRHAERRHDAAQHHDQRHHAGDAEALQLERVPLVQAFQFVVLEAQLIPQPALGRLHRVIHGGHVGGGGCADVDAVAGQVCIFLLEEVLLGDFGFAEEAFDCEKDREIIWRDYCISISKFIMLIGWSIMILIRVLTLYTCINCWNRSAVNIRLFSRLVNRTDCVHPSLDHSHQNGWFCHSGCPKTQNPPKTKSNIIVYTRFCQLTPIHTSSLRLFGHSVYLEDELKTEFLYYAMQAEVVTCNLHASLIQILHKLSILKTYESIMNTRAAGITNIIAVLEMLRQGHSRLRCDTLHIYGK